VNFYIKVHRLLHQIIAGSNPAGGMEVWLLFILYVVRLRFLRRADHSSRAVLPIVMRRSVWSRNLKNEEVMAAASHEKKAQSYLMKYSRNGLWMFSSNITIWNLRHSFNIEFYHLSLLFKKRAADETF